jgi:hypothetical protein
MTTQNVDALTSKGTTHAKKRGWLVAAAVLLLLLVGVGAVVFRLSYVSPDTPRNDGDPLYFEAKEQSQKFWDSTFVRCGDSYFGVLTFAGQDIPSQRLIYQLKEPEVVVSYEPEKELGQSDRFNGVEFSGKTFISASASRSYKDGKWDAWIDRTMATPSETTSTTVRKVKGKWQFGISKDSRFRFTPTTCSSIPK